MAPWDLVRHRKDTTPGTDVRWFNGFHSHIGIVILNRDSGPPVKGSTILVPQTGRFADGQPMPGGCVNGEYKIRLLQRSGLEFYVDVFGLEQ
ncbi:MAG: hypothetical protein WBO24_11740 [Nitrospirales bacterium]